MLGVRDVPARLKLYYALERLGSLCRYREIGELFIWARWYSCSPAGFGQKPPVSKVAHEGIALIPSRKQDSMSSVLAIVFWWFYIIVCPVSTLIALFFSVKLDKDGRPNFYRAFGFTCLLVLVLGTAGTSVGPMSWWFANIVGDRQTNDYYVWQYALVCILVQTCVILVKLRRFKYAQRNSASE